MAFGNTPKDVTLIPLGSVAVPGHSGGDLTALRGASASTDSNGNETAAVSAVIENVTALGQTTMAASSPVVLASDQPGLSQVANKDGLAQGAVLAEGAYLFSGGGPIDSTGKPQQLSYDRLRSIQGKQSTSQTITTTVAGDVNLVFSVAPKTLMPGQTVMLQGATTTETVFVALSYTPSSTATTIPLQVAIVQSGHTTAKWSVYNASGPAAGGIIPDGVLPVINVIQDLSNASSSVVPSFWMPTGGNVDGVTPRYIPAAEPFLFNGTTADRQRGNVDVQLLASAARTTTQTPTDIVNYNSRGIKVWLDMTVVGTGSVTLTINGKDPGSGTKYTLLLSGAAVIANSTNVYTVYPGAPVTTNISANDVLPRTFQIVVTANNANSATYSVGYSLIV